MRKIFCDGCRKELTGRTYYSIGEIEKNLPAGNPKRWLHLVRGRTQIVGKEESWVAYLDLHFCEACYNKPVRPKDFLRLSGGR